MVAEFSESVNMYYFPWVAKYLVAQASMEPNLHTMFMTILQTGH